MLKIDFHPFPGHADFEGFSTGHQCDKKNDKVPPLFYCHSFMLYGINEALLRVPILAKFEKMFSVKSV